MDVTQSTSVSPMAPVRMEEHVSLVTTATPTTTAHVLPTTQDRTMRVCSNCLLLEDCCECVMYNLYIYSQQTPKCSHSHAVCSLLCEVGYAPDSDCMECVLRDACEAETTDEGERDLPLEYD